jgi:hypothetical protein
MNHVTSIVIVCAALALAAPASCGSGKNATARNANTVGAATPTAATPAPSQTPEAQRPAGGEAMKVLAAGQYGKVEEPFLVVAREAKVYGELHALAEGLPELGADFFGKHAVVAAFAGTRNSGGYGVEIRRGADRRLVVEETTPPKGAMTTMALTQPFKVVAVEVGEEESVEFDLGGARRSSTRWRPYVVTSSEFDSGGGFAGRYEKLTLAGTLRVARLGRLVTVLFDLKGQGGTKERALRGAATGIGGDAAGVEIPHLDAGTLVDHPRPPLRVSGQFAEDAAKLSMTFESLPTNVSDGFGGTGKLEAKATGPAAAKGKQPA